MPQHTASCQLPRPRQGDSRQISPQTDGTPCPNQGTTTLVHGAAQELDHTPSRHTGPRRWLRAVHWLITAGLHPKANATTQAVADDLAARMDYSTGHVRYRMQDTADRIGIHVSNVKRHIRYLRELGALAWVQHGSRSNIRRTLGLGGYAGTATVYAAVIPPAYDHAMGHTLIGTGYGARIVIDQRVQTPRPVDNSPVDNPASGSCAPPSLTWVEEEGKLKVESGVTTTAKRSSTESAPHHEPKTASSSRRKRRTILGRTVTAAGMQAGDRLARTIRRHIPWTRRASHNELRWVCADMGEQQWTDAQAIDFVTAAAARRRDAGLLWQPAKPHRLLAADLVASEERAAADRQHREDLAAAVDPMSNPEWRALVEQSRAVAALTAAINAEPERTDDDRRAARMDWNNWREVVAHYDDDPDDALDLYGQRFVTYAIRQDGRRREASNDLAFI